MLQEFTAKSFFRRFQRYIDGVCRSAQTTLHGKRKASSDTVPPSTKEIQWLLEYLKANKCHPVIVGSSALLRHLELTDAEIAKDFRPTADVDIFVHNPLPQIPTGWKKDYESVGVDSWIAPSGGVVDFLLAGHEFPAGPKYPANIAVDPISDASGLPVAAIKDLVGLKLNSDRAKDLSDLLLLAQAGGFPSEMKGLNRKQKENYAFVMQWLQAKKNEVPPK